MIWVMKIFFVQFFRVFLPSDNRGLTNYIIIIDDAKINQISRSVMSNSLPPHESQHTRPPCPSPAPGVYSDPCPSSQYAIQPSHPLSSPSPLAPNPSQHQSLFQWVNSSHEVPKVLDTGVSALASFLPKKSQGWSPSEWTGWISLQSKWLSRVFANTTVQKHQFFGTQSNSHIHTWPQEKP